jgi:hypothetical protein
MAQADSRRPFTIEGGMQLWVNPREIYGEKCDAGTITSLVPYQYNFTNISCLSY